MGTASWSLAIPSGRHEAVEQVVRAWHAAKGYEPIDDEPLFELHE